MVGFFDYLFYLIYKFYSPKEKGAATTSAMIIGGMQAINVLSIIMSCHPYGVVVAFVISILSYNHPYGILRGFISRPSPGGQAKQYKILL